MRKYIQHEFLKVSHLVTGEWLHPVHNHNHFEIIFIHRGKGIHCLSGMRYLYSGKMMFLLAPCDFHHFDIQEETEFTFLKFTNVYLKRTGGMVSSNGLNQEVDKWNREMDEFLIHARSQGLPLLKREEDAERISKIMRLIVEEWKESHNEESEVIFLFIQAILSIVRRNIQPVPALINSKHHEKITAIVNYIHQHIHVVEHTQLEHLSSAFGYSKNYLGIFFKEQTGVPLRDYVNQYKLHLIENRLRYSSLSLKEISNELGFTDPSHLSKFFKAHQGINPSDYRSKLSALQG
jgi:AraC-like DNA-binding protein